MTTHSGSIWLIIDNYRIERTCSKDPKGVEYIPAKHYNDLINWLHDNYTAEHAPEQEITQ